LEGFPLLLNCAINDWSLAPVNARQALINHPTVVAHSSPKIISLLITLLIVVDIRPTNHCGSLIGLKAGKLHLLGFATGCVKLEKFRIGW